MRLVINNIDIPLVPGENIELTRSNAQVSKLSSRSSSFTNDFKAAMTAGTIAALGYSNELSSENDINPETRYEAQVIRESGGEIARGFVQIVSADLVANEFTLTFFTGNRSWIDEISGKSIRDVYLRDFDHLYNEAAIVASWSNTSGYVYPLVDYGTLGTIPNFIVPVESWFPSVFQSTLIQRIFEDIGWVAAGSFIDSWAYKHKVIAFTNSQFLEDNSDELDAEAVKTSVVGYDLTATPVAGTSDTDTQVIEFDTVIKDELGAFDLGTFRYTADRTLNDAVFNVSFLTTTASINFAFASSTDASIKIQLRKNGTQIAEQVLISATNESGTYTDSTSGNFYLSITEDLVATDYIDAAVVLEYSGAIAGSTIVQLLLQVGSFKIELASVNNEIIEGGNVTLANNLPDIDQADFVKDMIITYGLLAIPDQYAKTVSFEPFSKVVDNENLAQNLSDYINILTVSSINFDTIAKDYAKKSRFYYADPNDDDTRLTEYNNTYPLPFGAGEFQIENDFIPGVKDIYKSMFEASIQIKSTVTTGNFTWMPSIPRTNADGDELKTGPRTLYVVQDAECIDFSTFNVIKLDVTTYSQTAFAFFTKPFLNSSLDNITESLAFDIPEIPAKMGDGLLDRYYPDWLNILNKPRFVEIGCKLFPHQFEGINFALPVYIETQKIRGYFLIDEIIYRDGNDILRLIQLQ